LERLLLLPALLLLALLLLAALLLAALLLPALPQSPAGCLLMLQAGLVCRAASLQCWWCGWQPPALCLPAAWLSMQPALTRRRWQVLWQRREAGQRALLLALVVLQRVRAAVLAVGAAALAAQVCLLARQV
jgi:hypothetical protein